MHVAHGSNHKTLAAHGAFTKYWQHSRVIAAICKKTKGTS